jgi:hypothetical protein
MKPSVRHFSQALSQTDFPKFRTWAPFRAPVSLAAVGESRERGTLSGEDRVRRDEDEVAACAGTQENASADQLCLASVRKRHLIVYLTNFLRQRFPQDASFTGRRRICHDTDPSVNSAHAPAEHKKHVFT